MSTFAGKQQLGALLSSLIELEHDTQAAFEAAIARLQRPAYKQQLQAFLADQQQHILDLKTIASPMCDVLPHGPDARQIVTKGLLMLAHLAGDRAILHALAATLNTMNLAYERALTHGAVTPVALGVVQRHFLDERRHRDWLLGCLNPEDSTLVGQHLDHDPAFFDLNGRPPVHFKSGGRP